MPLFRWTFLLVSMTFSGALASPPPGGDAVPHIPASQGVALDGRNVTLPRDLFRATILIVGFGRNSGAPAMAWGIKVQSLVRPPSVGFYDLPVLAEAPSFVRPVIIRSIRKQVPDTLKPSFVPLTENADTWKRLTAFAPAAPDAAYVLLVDRSGAIRWQTHEPLSPATFDQLAAATQKLIAENHNP